MSQAGDTGAGTGTGGPPGPSAPAPIAAHARLLALGAAGGSLVFYLLGFLDNVALFALTSSVPLVLGAGLLGGAALLPRAGRVLLPAAVLGVVGFLTALQGVLAAPALLLAQQTSMTVVGAIELVLAFGIAVALVAAVLVDAGLISLPKPKPAPVFPGPAAQYPGYPPQHPGVQPPGQPFGQHAGFGPAGGPSGGYPAQPGYPPYPGAPAPYGQVAPVQTQIGKPGQAQPGQPGPGGYPQPPAPFGYPGAGYPQPGQAGPGQVPPGQARPNPADTAGNPAVGAGTAGTGGSPAGSGQAWPAETQVLSPGVDGGRHQQRSEAGESPEQQPEAVDGRTTQLARPTQGDDQRG